MDIFEDAAFKQHVKVSALEDVLSLCQRCAAVPWHDYEQLKNYSSLACFTGIESTNLSDIDDALYQSGCRICCFMAEFILWNHARIKFCSQFPTLAWIHKHNKNLHVSYMTNNRLGASFVCYGVLEPQDADSPLLLVSRNQPSEVDAIYQHLCPPVLNYTKVKDWIRHCETHHHGSCAPSELSEVVGLRVIDCAQRAIVQAPSKCCFVALSYVWGQVTQPTLNFLEPWKDVPKTIQQAIDLVLDLGYRFLWVDRYVSSMILS